MITKEEFISIISKIKSELKSLLSVNEIYNSELCLDVSMMYLEAVIPDLYKYPDIRNMLEKFIVCNEYEIETIYDIYSRKE